MVMHMTTKLADKAYQFAVSTPANPEKQVFLVEGGSEPVAEQRLRRELKLPPNALIILQRLANVHDIERANLTLGRFVRLK
jgi:hypothetical protein